ncbi:major facilitator superfamily domain-containing protein, partial [Xylariales sp. PMI_506]
MVAVPESIKWFYREFGIRSIHETGRNAYFIILARTCRMMAYGASSVILAIFFSALQFSDHQIGLFMTLTLLGDVFLGTFLTLVADKAGRRRVLMAGSLLMIISGATFAFFENFWILLLAAVVGVISATGSDFGPFRSIEESMLSQLTTSTTRSDVVAWYVTSATLGSSVGSEAAGRIIRYLKEHKGWEELDTFHALFWIYSLMGVVNVVLVLFLTKECELQIEDIKGYNAVPQAEGEDDDGALELPNSPSTPSTLGRGSMTLPLPEQQQQQPEPKQNRFMRVVTWLSKRLSQISAPTRSIMYKLWFLLGVDSLADGMVSYPLTNYYMDVKFHPDKSTLGDVTSVAYFLSAASSIFAGPLARKIGLISTMVFTHAPSSAAVVLFPFPSQFWLTTVLLFVRAGLNNMDQAPRTAFIAAVVPAEERTAAMGITAMLRTLASTAGPSVTGFLAAGDRFWIAFVVAGSCRLAYDFGLYAMFFNMKLHEHED